MSTLLKCLSIARRIEINQLRKSLHNNIRAHSSSAVASDEVSVGPVQPTSIKRVLDRGKVDDRVRVQGWIRGYRKQKDTIFLDLNDGSSHHRLPLVLPATNKPPKLNMHASVDVTGVLVQSPKSPHLELHPTSDLIVLGGCDQKEYPLAGKVRYTQDYVRQFVHLRAKTNRFSSLLRLRGEATRAVHDYFHANNFLQIHTPILTSNDCEGAGEAFQVFPNLTEKDPEEFFKKKVHLTVSSQLHLEAAASGLEKVWSFSPVFRAEKQLSSRHLSEFYMVEAEQAFAYEIEDITKTMEGLVKYCLGRVLWDFSDEWGFYTGRSDSGLQSLLESVWKSRWTVMTFDEAKCLLESRAQSKVPKNTGLSREQELILVEKLNDGVPVFVVDWPKSVKPFYMRQCPSDPDKVSGVDLLVPRVGELCGGSLREWNVETLEGRLAQVDPTGSLKTSLDWYLDLRRFGGVPSGGFGLGFDRLMQLLCGQGNIKDVCFFPRYLHHCPM